LVGDTAFEVASEMSKTKDMIVIVDKLGYFVPASIVQALRRTFDTKFARTNGESMAAARRFVFDRIRSGQAIEYQHENPRRLSPDLAEKRRVADVLAERLVRGWLRDGYLEVVTRGRYRRCS
jgi:hypothetical protein